MTIIQVPANTELRSMPFARKAGYSPYRSNMDSAGRVQNIAIFGDAQVGQRTHDIAVDFHYGFFLDELIINTIGGALVTSDDAMLISTIEVAGDASDITTRNAIFYQAGFDSQAIFTVVFSSYDGDAVIHQHIGVYDGLDGFVFGAAHGVLHVERYKGGARVDHIEQSSFNLDKIDGSGVSGFKIVTDNLNVYRIQYGYLGIMPVIFEVFGGAQLGWIPIHSMDFINKQDETIIRNPYLPIRMHNEILSGTPDIPIVLRTASWYGGTLGGARDYGDLSYFATRNVIALGGSGAEKPLIALRNKATFRGVDNFIRSALTYFSFSSDGNKAVTFDAYANPIYGGGETWVDVDTDFSVMEVAKAGVTYTGGRYLGSMLLNKVANGILQFNFDEVVLNPNDSLLMVVQSDSNSEANLSMRWGEAR